MKHEEFLKQVKELAEITNGPTLLKLIAIIEKLREQRNRWICATTITSAEWLANKDDQELDEIVGQP